MYWQRRKVVNGSFRIVIRRVSQAFEQGGDTYAQCVSQHLDGVDGWVGTTRFDARHVGSGEAAPICERFLAHAHSHTEHPDSGAELLLERW